MKKNNKRGFTLAELLIVVAIIAVLVAVAIPVFTSQLEKSRDSTDQANIRAAYAELSAAIISAPKTDDIKTELDKGSFSWAKDEAGSKYTVTLAGKGTNDTWDNIATGDKFKLGKAEVSAVANFTTVEFTIDDNNQITTIEPKA